MLVELHLGDSVNQVGIETLAAESSSARRNRHGQNLVKGLILLSAWHPLELHAQK